MSAVVVVAPVPFVTTIAKDPADAVLLLILRADPVVAPLILSITSVVEAVIAEFVIVNVRSAAAAIETEVNVALPDLPLTTTGEAAAPLACAELRRIPVPAAVPTKFPLVAVMLPKVAVIEVPAFTCPAVATILPVVDVIPVPAVTVVVAARVVVVTSDPGAIIAEGSEEVIVEPAPVVVIWLAVPKRFMLPAVGLIAPPESPVRVAKVEVEAAADQLELVRPLDADWLVKMYSVLLAVFIHLFPIG